MLQTQYRDIPDYESWPDCVTRVEDISSDDSRVSFYREKNSHRGISGHTHIRELIAKQVNQEFLEEICELKELEYLETEIVTAEDLKALQRLPHLKALKIDSPRNAKDFESLLELPRLEKLFIQNAKHLHSLEPLSAAHRLISLGVEGGMWTRQKIPSLKPLEGLVRLEALFLTSVQLGDKDLSCLATIPNLRLLRCSRFAPKAAFGELRQLMPQLECSWCDRYEIEGP